MFEDILVEQRDGTATVIFNRPEQRNDINYFMWLDLQRIAADLETSPDVQVVVFKGAGGEAFSAGADIKDFDLYRNNSAKARVYASAVDGALDALERLSKPTLCLMKGYCVGGGFELTNACNLRIASETAKVGITAARLGIAIGYREMRRLVQLAGHSVALDLLLTGRLVDAREALHLGLVSQVIEATQVEEHTYDLAARIAGLAPLSHKAHKEIVRKVMERPDLTDLTAEEEALPFRHFDSQDFIEGRQAFLEKRRAEFRGQ